MERETQKDIDQINQVLTIVVSMIIGGLITAAIILC